MAPLLNIPPPTPRQARLIWFSVSALAVAILSALACLLIWALGWVLRELSAVLLPATLALILAYILDPVVEFFVRKNLPRRWAIALVFLLATLLIAGVLGSVVPGIVRETRELVNTLPANADKLRDRIQEFLKHSTLGRQLPAFLQPTPPSASRASTNPTEPILISPNWKIPQPGSNYFNTSLNLIDLTEPPPIAKTNLTETTPDTEALNKALGTPLSETVMLRLVEVLKSALIWVVNQLAQIKTWVEFVIGFILVPLYLFYFLLEKQGISRRWSDYLPLRESRTKDEVVFVLQSINDCLIVFFRGQVLVALCVGVLLTIGYSILGLNYAVLIGLVAATLGVVPYLGAITSLVLALTVAAVQFGDWTHPLLVLAIAATVKLLEDFIISPKIIGDRSGLHPLAIIIAVMVGTTVLGGILGALFAIPLTAVLRTLMFRYIWKSNAAASPAPSLEEPIETPGL